MVMRYLWLPFRLVLWAIPTALVSLFWNAHVRSAFATVGLVPLAGVPVWLQPLVVAPAVLSVAGLVAGLMLVPRWAAAIEGGDAGAWHYRTGWLFDLWAMAGLIAVAGFVTVGVVGSPDPLWGLGAVPALVGLGIVIVLCGLGIAAGVHGLVHDAITKGLTRRDPRTPGYRLRRNGRAAERCVAHGAADRAAGHRLVHRGHHRTDRPAEDHLDLHRTRYEQPDRPDDHDPHGPDQDVLVRPADPHAIANLRSIANPAGSRRPRSTGRSSPIGSSRSPWPCGAAAR